MANMAVSLQCVHAVIQNSKCLNALLSLVVVTFGQASRFWGRLALTRRGGIHSTLEGAALISRDMTKFLSQAISWQPRCSNQKTELGCNTPLCTSIREVTHPKPREDRWTVYFKGIQKKRPFNEERYTHPAILANTFTSAYHVDLFSLTETWLGREESVSLTWHPLHPAILTSTFLEAPAEEFLATCDCGLLINSKLNYTSFKSLIHSLSHRDRKHYSQFCKNVLHSWPSSGIFIEIVIMNLVSS